MKKISLCFLCLVFAGLTSCSKSLHQEVGIEKPSLLFEPVAQEENVSSLNLVRVGMLLPLSGDNASVGEDLRNAAMLAQFEIGDDAYVLQFYDTKGTADGAKDAFKQALNDNVEVVLGPVFAAEVGAIRSKAQSEDIPVLSFTSDTTKLGKGVYSLALLLSDQTERVIRYACENKKTRLAVLAPDNYAGDIAIETAMKVAPTCGISVDHVSVYNPTFINFDPYVRNVLPKEYLEKLKQKELEKGKKKQEKEPLEEEQSPEPEEEKPELSVAEQLDFDALLIADDGNRLKSIASLFGLYDVTPKDVLFLGMATWQDKSLTTEGALQGGIFPVLPAEGFDAFARKYEETFAKKPMRLASYAYDAVSMTALIRRKYGKILPEYITQPSGFLGTDGLIRFHQNGLPERLMGLSKICSRNKFSVVEKAYPSFGWKNFAKEHYSDLKIINEGELEKVNLKRDIYSGKFFEELEEKLQLEAQSLPADVITLEEPSTDLTSTDLLPLAE